MICQECNERQATIHLTYVMGDKMMKRDLCEVCGKEFVHMPTSGAGFPHNLPALANVDTLAAVIGASHPRYAEEAYLFVQAALRKAQREGSKISSAGVVG